MICVILCHSEEQRITFAALQRLAVLFHADFADSADFFFL